MTNQELKGQAVYLLRVTIHPESLKIIPFADEADLRVHVCDLISKHGLSNLDSSLKRQVITFLESKNYDLAITYFKRAMVDNTLRPKLDFYWDVRPSVIL